MNKISLWFWVIVILIAIGSCTSDEASNPTNESTPQCNQETTAGTRESVNTTQSTHPTEAPPEPFDDTKTPAATPTIPLTTTPPATDPPPTEEAKPTDTPKENVTKLDNIEYWDTVKPEIIAMLEAHNLYVAYIDNGYPYVNITVKYGVINNEGKFVATGISQSEYEAIYASVKQELHEIIDKYQLAKPKTIFHACSSKLGIFFHNWFYDKHGTPYKVVSKEVAYYQIELLEYYYNRIAGNYIMMEGASETVWSKYPVYIP